eukprot:9511889-Alexandrium_andersonii.AAC.1
MADESVRECLGEDNCKEVDKYTDACVSSKETLKPFKEKHVARKQVLRERHERAAAKAKGSAKKPKVAPKRSSATS